MLFVLLVGTPATADDPPWSYDLNLTEVRTIDGSGNSIGGAANTRLLRMAPADYPGDGSGSEMIAFPDRENPRVISNRIAAQGNQKIFNKRRLSDYLWAWGQFIDHDLDLTEAHSDNGIADILIDDPDDPLGPAPILFSRSNYDLLTGLPGMPRSQMNEITAFVDASNVYGSDDIRAAALRTFVDGRLATSAGNLLPFNTLGLPNAGGHGSTLFLAGDVRANENVMLTSLHTLFVREHNRLAALIQLLAPQSSDEEIYQLARKIVAAELQIITYREFLPALLGPAAPPLESLGYDSQVDPSIANEFSTAFFRFGHSLLSSKLKLSGAGQSVGTLPLRDAFFRPSFLTADPSGVDRLLIGASQQRCQDVDNKIVDDVRNFLFGPPGAGGLDLAALNIQRGRDHGLPDYNTLREAYGLSRNQFFKDISKKGSVRRSLKELYYRSRHIDAWVGGLAEDHLPGSSVGELLSAAISDQFTRLLRGDRMSVLNDPDLDSPIVKAVIHRDAVTLANVVRANTKASRLPENIFSIDNKQISHVVVSYDGDANRIHITGNAARNTLSVTEVPWGYVFVGLNGTMINGSGIFNLITSTRPHVTVDLGDERDRLYFVFCRFADCVIEMGDGPDVLYGYLSHAARLAVDGGPGSDSYNRGIRTPRGQARLHNQP